jgi:predicted ATPase
MHLKSVRFHPDRYPTREHYPFKLDIFRRTEGIDFRTPVALFVGENGTGKSTLLEARPVDHVLLQGPLRDQRPVPAG